MSRDRTSSRRIAALALAALCALPAGVASAQAEKKPAARPADIYDTKLDAKALVASAVARARRDDTRVLVMFGFNTCGWCQKLHALLDKDPQLKKLVRDDYALAMVDIQAPHADELLDRCKAALGPEEQKRGVGYPFLAVLDREGKVVTAQRTDPLEEGDHHDPKKVLEFLTKNVATPRDAKDVLGEALAKASSDDKRVFLHFGAPWCGWCHKLDDFLAQEQVAGIIGRDYVDVKIDVDRMKNGKDVLARFNKTGEGGIPWTVILDASGKVLVTSDGPKGNIGYPAEPEEINHFFSMLEKTRRKIEPAQLDQLRKSLQEAADQIKAARRPASRTT